MKYFSDYNTYKLHSTIINKVNHSEELYEKNFLRWLIKSRKFGDLFSLKKVVKLSKRIAELDYIYDKELAAIQKENISKNRAANALTIDQANELKSYKEEQINLNNQLQHKYGDSDFLMYTSETIKHEEELKYIKLKRKVVKDRKEKARLQKLENITKTQTEILKLQVEDSVPDDKAVLNLTDVEKHQLQRKKEKRDSMLDRLNNQKLKFQTDEVRARTEFNKKMYSRVTPEPRKDLGKVAIKKITTPLKKELDNDIDIL